MDLLPVEIWCSIFRLLDPVGLIAASQACPKFRHIIQPSRVHFVERLLALECRAEYGGPVPCFHANDYELEPAWDEEAWTRMRWGCSGCLRLLPDAAFDNHSLLRLGYRKPTPGTPSSRAVTSWEPSANVLLRNRKLAIQNRGTLRAEEKKIRKQYAIALSWNWGIPKDSQDPLQRLMSFQDAGLREFVHCRLEYFQCMVIDEERDIFDRAAAAIEEERAGFRRHLRRCNECRWQRGEMKVRSHSVNEQGLRLSGPNIGTANVPIVRSRQVLLPSALDRWFPGWSSALGEDDEAKPPKTGRPLHFRIYHKLRQNEPWTLYMVRCRGCARWQELRAFRCGDAFHKWQPLAKAPGAAAIQQQFENWDGERLTEKYIDNLVCNCCFRERHGDERLARDLMLWWGVLADSELGRLEFDMSYGWRLLDKHAPQLLLGDMTEDDHAATDGSGGTAAAGAGAAIPMSRLTATVQFEQVKDRAALRCRQKLFAEKLYAPDTGPVPGDKRDKGTRMRARAPWSQIQMLMAQDETTKAWMGYWTREYGTMDDWWFWLRRCKDAFKADPKLLLMDRDFVAGVIRKGAKLERTVEWRAVSAWESPVPWGVSLCFRRRT
ncbi:hypothetical protein PG996_008905 [Apiospora saccharicola]|uniref:F-box domain-containing protein n=1 Tax=Apiospora saccharicola TaxID=335842 RepID=A0ABR1UZB4_9PEZI